VAIPYTVHANPFDSKGKNLGTIHLPDVEPADLGKAVESVCHWAEVCVDGAVGVSFDIVIPCGKAAWCEEETF
jgi:hypothetical protein